MSDIETTRTIAPLAGSDRGRTWAVAEDAQRIAQLAQELQRNAFELEGQSHKLRGTLEVLQAANGELDRRTSEIAAAQRAADAATARLARLQTITAALSNTVTQDAVAESVLREAMVAFECDAGAVVVVSQREGEGLELLRESGSLDPIMRSFQRADAASSPGPYAETVQKCRPVYLESFAEMALRYPAFAGVGAADSHEAWIFLPLEIGNATAAALAFGFAVPRRFTIAERQFADTVSRYCAQALDRVRLRVAAAVALTEARDARMMAEHANGAKTHFLRAMSHELRTPLNAVIGYAELLELGIHGAVNAQQESDLGRIKRAAAYLLRLINDLLTVARLEGARPLHLTSVPLNPLMAGVEELCAIQAREKDLTMKVTPAPSEMFVAADAEGVQQILLNLVTNAIKFTPAGGEIDVTCDSDDSMLCVRVKDSGVGVRMLDIDRVFEPFVQIDRHLTKAMQQGVGLGLSISRDLARAMHGDLALCSIEGVGSTFTLTLPLASARSLAPTIVASALGMTDRSLALGLAAGALLSVAPASAPAVT